MMKRNAVVYFLQSLLFVFFFVFNSCKTTLYLPKYFENLPGDTILNNLVTKDFELKIKKGDLIGINVSSLDPLESAIFNLPQISSSLSSSTGTVTSGTGFLVDMNGYILYPKLGMINVAGLTRDQLRDLLLKDLEPYLKQAVITVNFANHQITLLGNVNRPQVLNMASEELTLLQAIALSGDVNPAARINNVLIIRDSGSVKEFKRINLTDNSIFTSQYYYLKPNDIVYIEPDPKKSNPKTSNLKLILSYAATGISILTLILTRIIK